MMRFLFPFLLGGFLILASAPLSAQQEEPGGAGPNYEMRLNALEDQMRALQGRIEQSEFAAKRNDQAVQRLQSDIDARLSKLESAPAPAAATPSAPAPAAAPAPQATAPAEKPAPAASAKGTLGALTMQDGKVTGAVNKQAAPPLPEAPADYTLNSQEQYDRAFALLRQANYEEAGKAFKSFVDKNPQDKLVGNAKYWYGETLYVRGQFDAAAVAFADTYQQDPKGSKAPDSLLKLAMSLAAIEKNQEACTTLLSLKSKFPNAPMLVRQRAEEERGKLKCS